MDPEFYYTIDRTTTAEFKDRGSKFIAYTFPVQSTEDFKRNLETIKKEHPKATHHCFAYRLGLDNNTFRVSDDGEPSGTAGKPILGQIDSKKLTNILVIVVRYFGGTLLGVPGLINAYKSAASMALQVTPVIQKPIEEAYTLQFDYTQMNEVMMIVKQWSCSVLEKDMNLFCRLVIGIPKGRLEEALYKFKEIRNVEITKNSL
jgi:uncharacterized YigZ family protein